jgi:hypothetical protein
MAVYEAEVARWYHAARVKSIRCITCLVAVLVVALALPAMGQEIPMYDDTLWVLNSRTQVYPFNGYSNGLGYAPATNTLYSGTEVGLIALYDAETGVLKDTILLAHKRIYGLDVSADGTRIYVHVQDSAAKRDYVTLVKSQIIEYPSKRLIADSVPGNMNTKLSPDGNFLALSTNRAYDIDARTEFEIYSPHAGYPSFALDASRIAGCARVSAQGGDERFSFRLFDYKNRKMELDTILGSSLAGVATVRAHGNLVAILTHTYMWFLDVYRLPSMEKIWATAFTESDGFGFFDFLDDEHIICRTDDQKYGMGTWIYKLGTNVEGYYTRPIGQTIGLGRTPSITSRDGRLLFAAEGVLLSAVNLRGVTSSINDTPKPEGSAPIYPNPTNGTFTVQLAGCSACDVSWELVSLSGERSAAGRGQTDDGGNMTTQVPMAANNSSLAPGRYTLRVTSGSRAWSFVLVVM